LHGLFVGGEADEAAATGFAVAGEAEAAEG
jgi:hypothetical protein